MSEEIDILGGMLAPSEQPVMPASFDTGTVTEVVDSSHVKVDLGDKQVTTFVPESMNGAPVVDSTVRVSMQENTYALDSVIQGGGAGMLPVGAVTMWLTTTAPEGWLKLDGSTFDANTYPVLFDILGTTTLPNMTDRFPVGVSGTKAIKTTGGSATVTLTEAQLPSHDHTMTHTHTMAHTHDMANHTHDMTHTHTMAHTHNMAHVHGTQVGVHSVQYASGSTAFPLGDTGSTGTGFQTGGSSATNTGAASNSTTSGPNDTTTGVPISNTTGGSSAANTGASSAANTGTAGSGSAVTVQNPYLSVNFIIKAK
jgi:microcystin-dependent protein